MKQLTEKLTRITARTGRRTTGQFTLPHEVTIPARQEQPDIEILIRRGVTPMAATKALRAMIDHLTEANGAQKALRLPEIREASRAWEQEVRRAYKTVERFERIGRDEIRRERRAIRTNTKKAGR